MCIAPCWSATLRDQRQLESGHLLSIWPQRYFRSDITGRNGPVAHPERAPTRRPMAPASRSAASMSMPARPMTTRPAFRSIRSAPARGATFAAAKAYVKANAFQTNKHDPACRGRERHRIAHRAACGQAGCGHRRRAIAADTVTGDADALSKSLAFFTGNGSVISGKIEVAEAYGEVGSAASARHDRFPGAERQRRDPPPRTTSAQAPSSRAARWT